MNSVFLLKFFKGYQSLPKAQNIVVVSIVLVKVIVQLVKKKKHTSAGLPWPGVVVLFLGPPLRGDPHKYPVFIKGKPTGQALPKPVQWGINPFNQSIVVFESTLR